MILTWYFEGVPQVSNNCGPTYRLDADYRAVRVWAHLAEAPKQDIIFDINDDGVSIFTDRPQIDSGLTEGRRSFGEDKPRLAKNSLISLDIDKIGAIPAGSRGRQLTIQLDLEPV